MFHKDTIAAISTGMSNSGIGIVRISGDEAFQIIDKIYKGKEVLSKAQGHTIHYGFIKNEDEILDEVLVSIMRAPRTFTGEDTVEINCHGGVYVVKKVLECVISHGARPAEPGEFTKRAFLNGKMDLSQSEAVIDLIMAENEYALKSSVSQLKGNVKKKIQDLRSEILYHTAFIETALDDPEHISVDGYGEELRKAVDKIIKELVRLIDSSDDGRIIKEGIQTVILGKPNAGKSSLLNVLSGHERAIVTDVAGTTRDILEEHIQLKGISLNIIDTAGIRDTKDIVEKIGVDKAKEYAKDADLLVYVVDASKPLDDNDREIIKFLVNRKCIVLLNKTDLDVVVNTEVLQKEIKKITKEIKLFTINTDDNQLDKEVNKIMTENHANQYPVLEISAKNETGIETFNAIIESMFIHGNLSFNDEIYITNVRQKKALQDAKDSLIKVMESIDMGMPEDFYSIDLMDAYESLGSITGEAIGEDLVNEIFSKFCMGK